MLIYLAFIIYIIFLVTLDFLCYYFGLIALISSYFVFTLFKVHHS